MGGKSSTSTSKVTIPPEVLARYNAVNARAEAAASAPYKAFGNTAADYVAQMNAQQNAGIAGINATVGSYQPYFNEAGAATRSGMGPAYEGIDNYMSPYIKNVADTTGAYMRQQQEQSQSGALGNAISSGAFGGDRAGIAAANLQQQNQMGYGKTMADIMNQGYTQALGASQADLARQMAGGAQLASLGAQSQQLGLQGAQAQLAAGTMQQQTEQAGKDAMIQRFMQEQGYPFQVAQFLANIAMGTGAAQGSTTITETPRSVFGFAQGGGVSGPRTYSQGTIGGEGYIPVGDLPVGQLMVANPPEQTKDDSVNKILELIKMIGAKNGGAIDQRHGYALDGTVLGQNTEELRRQQEIRDAIAGLGLADRARSEANTAAAMEQKYNNPVNSMAPNVIMPNAVSGIVAQPQSVGPEEAWDVPVRSGMTQPEQPFRSGLVPFRSSPAMGGPGTFASGEMPFPHPQARPEGLGYQPTMPEGGPVTMPTGLMPESLAPATSLRPAARPVDLNVGVGGADVAADAMRRLGTVAGPETFVDPISGLKNVKVSETPIDFAGVQPIHQPTDWDAAKAKIIPRESGNDPNALLGFSNREGGAFAGTKLTDMTVDQAIDFSKPGSPYANYSKEKLGYIATPMGTFQIVGQTLRNAKAEMGLTGNEKMTPELQESIAKHLYDTYGMKPWAASESVAKTDNGLGNADMAAGQTAPAGGVKPYADRNMIGKFFHDPTTGKLNPNAVMSLLSGLGSMAQAQTISPIGAILAGIAGGSDTYKKLISEEPKRVSDVLANNAAARLQYQTQVALGETRPFDQWAADQFGSGAQSMVGGPNGNVAPASQISGVQSIMGVPLDPTGSGFAMPIQLPNGSGTILASQSYAYNSQLADSVARDAALGIQFAVNTLQIARDNIKAIEANKGKVQTTDGRIIDDPTYTNRMFGANSATADLDTSTKLQQALPTMTQNAQNYRRRTDQLAKALSTMPSTGPLAGWFSTVGGIANEFGIPVGSDAATGYQTAYKTLADEALTSMADLAGTVDTSTLARQIQGSNPTPEMTPQAIEHVLAIRAAVSDYQVAMADYLNKAMADPSNAGKNLAQLQREFAANNDIANFVAQEDQKYAGMIEPIMPPGYPHPEAFNDPTVTKEERRAMIQEWNATHRGNANGQP